jgi:hypothetical protein
MADNPIEHNRTKHIAIQYHFLRDHQQKGDIEIAYINTKDQLADIFTKPLDEQSFNHISFMSMTNVFSSVILCLVIDIEREMEYSAKKALPLKL